MPPPKEFAKVGPPWWNDKPTIIVGCGVSLAGFDFNRLRGLGHVLAVKEAVWDVPFADACFSLHLPWQKTRNNELRELAARMPLYLGVPANLGNEHFHDVPGAIYIERCRINNGLMLDDSSKIESGGNSGFGALNLAVHKRAKDIWLFGFDYIPDAGHYCHERYDQPRNQNARYWLNWGDNFLQTVKQLSDRGIAVTNASIKSTLKAFPKVSIETALELLDWRRAARGGGVRGSAA